MCILDDNRGTLCDDSKVVSTLFVLILYGVLVLLLVVLVEVVIASDGMCLRTVYCILNNSIRDCILIYLGGVGNRGACSLLVSILRLATDTETVLPLELVYRGALGGVSAGSVVVGGVIEVMGVVCVAI